MELDFDAVIKVPESGVGEPTLVEEAILLDPRVNKILIPGEHIQSRVATLAQRICKDCMGVVGTLDLVVVLDGAFMFAADLGREIYEAVGPEVKYHFIKTATYGEEIKDPGETTREVKIELKPKNIQGKDVLIIEDLIDQAFTLSRIEEILSEGKPNSIKICVLLNKKLDNPVEEVKASKEQLTLDYVGFEVPDRWVAGYGIDAGHDFRHLPFIVVVNESHYLKNEL